MGEDYYKLVFSKNFSQKAEGIEELDKLGAVFCRLLSKMRVFFDYFREKFLKSPFLFVFFIV